MGCGGLIGRENVAGMRDQDEFSVSNSLGDETGVRGWNEPVGFAVNDESGSRDLREAARGFPAENSLQLTHISLGSGIPLHADDHVFVDALAWRGSVIDERDDGLLGFFRSEVTAHKSLQRGRFGLHGMGTARRGAAKNQRTHAAR